MTTATNTLGSVSANDAAGFIEDPAGATEDAAGAIEKADLILENTPNLIDNTSNSIENTSSSIENSSSFGNYLIHGIDEIILPDPITYWPTAPGWQVLGVLVGVIVIIRAIQRAKRWWRNRYRREALRQLGQIQKQAGKQLQDVVAVLPHFIKVTALQAYPRKEVASLNGKPWLAFLDEHYSGPAFSEGIGEKLLALAYLPREQWQLNDQESNELIHMTRRWIALHSEATDV